jgi:hypothetical protein
VFTYTRDRVVLPRGDWPAWVTDPGVAPRVVPVGVCGLQLPPTAATAVTIVDGITSLLSPGRKTEGVVWHRANGVGLAVLGGRPNFKTISNRYLLKHDQ